MIGWVVGCLAGWVAGWSVGWLARWLVAVSKGILKESYTNPYEIQPASRQPVAQPGGGRGVVDV